MPVRGSKLHQPQVSWKTEWNKCIWIFEITYDYTTILELNEAECELKLR